MRPSPPRARARRALRSHANSASDAASCWSRPAPAGSKSGSAARSTTRRSIPPSTPSARSFSPVRRRDRCRPRSPEFAGESRGCGSSAGLPGWRFDLYSPLDYVRAQHLAQRKQTDGGQPWAGRFNEPVGELVKRFTASVEFDRRLAEFDIDGSLAHARMLRAAEILSAGDLAAIEQGLAQIRAEIG